MEGTIAEIRMFAGNFAPRNWAFCAGQTIAIASNTAFFSLLGTNYGGDGQTTFSIPDLRGRVPVGTGQGPGLANVVLGEVSGTSSVTLLSANMPSHTHTGTLTASNTTATNPGPGTTDARVLGRSVDRGGTAVPLIYAPAGSALNAPLGAGSVTVGSTGGSQPFSNMQPYLGMNYIICMFGIFPARN
jgi:microcystin-dependent protein